MQLCSYAISGNQNIMRIIIKIILSKYYKAYYQNIMRIIILPFKVSLCFIIITEPAYYKAYYKHVIKILRVSLSFSLFSAVFEKLWLSRGID